MKTHPPKYVLKFFRWFCREDYVEEIEGDLAEIFRREHEQSPRSAKVNFAWSVFKYFRPGFIKSFGTANTNTPVMLGSYIKTSGRNLMRNKLFSTINIVGLAISMSVGLLLIAFVHDLFNFDKFHENGDRIYRVTTWPGKTRNESSEFASSSIRTARLIQEKVPGIEQMALLRVGFGGDAVVGENTLPINGLWAEGSIFKIFTFPFVSGDPNVALSKPYSMVITEQTAKKLFGDKQALGQTVRFDTAIFEVTGVMKDIPRASHMQFEALGSFSTVEQKQAKDRNFLTWGSMWSNYIYLLPEINTDLADIRARLNEIAAAENAVNNENNQRALNLQPLYSIALGKDLSNSIGPTMPMSVVWIVSGLAFVVILSACFNYTNLSIARSMRRFKEIGLRKAIGAKKGQVQQQFLFEAIVISLLALIVSFALFLVLRDRVLHMAPELQTLITLELTPKMVVLFILFSIVVGAVAGFLPSMFFSKINVIHALKDASSVKIFKRMNLRRGLVIVQYTLTLMFITATVIGYNQYKSFLAFDLGFSTENILNVEVQGNNASNLIKAFGEIPEVEGISRSILINSVGNYWGGHAKYRTTNDSSLVWYNIIDENYFSLHDYKFVAGQNFIARPTSKKGTTEVVANETLLKKLDIAGGDPTKAIGEQVSLDGTKLTIVGVVKDFHYGKVDNPIEPVLFTFWTDETDGWLNLKVSGGDPVALRQKIETIWKRFDKVHPVVASFYKESIEKAYSEFSVMITVIGFLSILSITIASMGLFGMVVFTTETRLKEIGIRKVMGANSGNLILLLSRGFLVLLGSSALVALPATYFLFEEVILTSFPFHQPVGMIELFAGTLVVLLIAFIMITSQTTKATRTNPAQILRSE